MGYIYLLLTIVSESLAVIFMKGSLGFQNRLFTVLAVLSYGLSFVFLTLALKQLPAGIANAIWAGASAVLIAILGVVLFGEKLSAVQIVSLLLIVTGIIGLNITKLSQ